MLTVLDTHALIWLDQETSDLGVQSRQRVDAVLKDGQLAVSAISFWEATMLAAKGRITMALSPFAWRRDLLGLGLVEIPVDGEMGVTAAELDLHGNPADRIIAATALLRGAVLITADSPLLEWKSPMECFDARL